MKKFLCITLSLLLALSLVACNKDDTDTNSDNNGDNGVAEEQKVEIANQEVIVARFKCKYTVSGGGESGTLEGEKAAELYEYISGNATKPEGKKLDTSGQKNVYLSFQTDDEENSAYIDFLGSYIVCENGYVMYIPMDKPTEREYYKFSKDAYEEIVNIITEK